MPPNPLDIQNKMLRAASSPAAFCLWPKPNRSLCRLSLLRSELRIILAYIRRAHGFAPKSGCVYLQSCYSDRDNINGGSTMFRKKRFAAGKKAALSVSYDTANQKSQRYRSKIGFRAVLNGVDFPQIVGKDGTVHPPLTAQTVLLSFRLTGPDGVERVTGDYPIRIPGLHSGKPAHQSPPLFRSLPSGTVQITAGLSLPRTQDSFGEWCGCRRKTYRGYHRRQCIRLLQQYGEGA